MANTPYVVFSQQETEANDGEPMYWGNENGWGDLGDATVFYDDAPVTLAMVRDAQKITLRSPWLVHQFAANFPSDDELLIILEVALTGYRMLGDIISGELDLADDAINPLMEKLRQFMEMEESNG